MRLTGPIVICLALTFMTSGANAQKVTMPPRYRHFRERRVLAP